MQSLDYLQKKPKEMVLVVWFLDPKSYQSYIRTFLSISRSTEKLQALQFRWLGKYISHKAQVEQISRFHALEGGW